MKISAKKYFYIQTGLLVLLLILIIAATVGGNFLLQKQSKRLYDAKAERKAIESQETALVQAKKDVERYQDLNKIAKSVVPQDKDQAKTVREIVKIAQDNGVPIKSVTFANSTLGDAAPKAAPNTNSSESGQAATPKPTAQPSVSQVKPVEGIPGVYTLEIQVASNGEVSYQNFLKFLEALEKNRRTAHVSAISLDPSDDGKRLNFNLTLNSYLKP